MRATTILLGAALAAASGLAGCGGRTEAGDPGDPGERVSETPIEQVLEANRDSLMAVPGVVGVALGLCEDEPCIRVLLADSAARERAGIPERLEGHPVRVEVSGPFTPR